jgi:hypothetical protein
MAAASRIINEYLIIGSIFSADHLFFVMNELLFLLKRLSLGSYQKGAE